MMYIVALFLPGLAVILKGRIITGILLFFLQATLIGWLPATIIAFFVISNANTKKAVREALREATQTR